ncbi:accessory Sec system protein Asp2 [Arthrobacter sp. USHLN218]|uniref:accessory Sec system protein Asp2 n=1 Tax=Arthrobacter sp. USHLN218 TaxID=3081232 RepID=UPI0030183667
MAREQTEHTLVHEGVTVHCKSRPAKLDRRHLVVMFAGIRPIDSYEFDGRGSRDSQANWLWLKDDFGGQYSYYLCNGLDFSVERAVIAAIDQELDRLGLGHEDCTLVGFSKGGFAALYYGIKYDFPNIVASAPQIYIGSHTAKHRPVIHRHLTRTGSGEELQLLDSLLPDAVAKDARRDRNIYVFSSVQDQFHAEQVEPALPLLRRYSNFNYIETDSDLVNEHSDITRYNMPLLLSVLYALGENVVPRYGEVSNGFRQDPEAAAAGLRKQRSSSAAVVELRAGKLAGPKFFPQGVAFLRGHAADRPGALGTSLVLEGDAGRYEFPLVQVQDRGIYQTHYEDFFCDYRFGKFRAPDDGLDLAGLPRGDYKASLALSAESAERTAACVSTARTTAESNDGGDLVTFAADSKGSVLRKRPILGDAPHQAVFEIKSQWARGDRVHFDGTFAVRGTPMAGWESGRYYLVLASDAHVRSLPLAGARVTDPADYFGDGAKSHTHARFATQRFAGVSLAGLEPGLYEAHVSLSAGGAIHTVATGRRVRLQEAPDGSLAASLLGPRPAVSNRVRARRLIRAVKRRADRMRGKAPSGRDA